MKYELRDYQEKIIEDVKCKIQTGKKNVIIQAPTGSGKGLIMSQINQNAIDKKRKVLNVIYGNSIIEQTISNYKKYHGIDCGIFQGRRKNIKDVTVASISSISRQKNLDWIQDFDLLLVDEAHNTVSNSYQKLFKALRPDALSVGLTATPYCLGNKLIPHWDSFVQGPSYDDLVARGFLVPYKYFAPKSQIDTKGIATINGDFDSRELLNRALSSNIVGDVVKTYKEKANGTRAFLFAINKAHSIYMRDLFLDAGIPACHADADTPMSERLELLDKFRRKEILILCNVNIFSTGVDVTEAETLISVRPTKSPIVYFQQNGRVLRKSDNKNHAIFLDHSGNYSRLGLPNQQREPDLLFMNPKKRLGKVRKNENTFGTKLCPKCDAINKSKDKNCNECGFEFKIDISNILKRTNVDSGLEEIKYEMSIISGIKSDYIKLLKIQNIKGFKKWFPIYKLLEKYDERLVRSVIDFPSWITKRN